MTGPPRSRIVQNIEKAVHAMTGAEVRALTWTHDQLEQYNDLVSDLMTETTDEVEIVIVLRALAVYRSFVAHARRGGKVQYVNADGSPPRTLKVRLR